MSRTSSSRSSRRSEQCRLPSVVSSLLLAMSALGPFSVEALDAQMGLARISHEMFALNNKMVVMGGSKFFTPPGFDNVTATDGNYLQTASIVTYDDWASKDTIIESGQSLTTFAAACARWDTEKVICTGGLKPGHIAPDHLECFAFSLGGFQAFAGTGVVNAEIGSKNLIIPARCGITPLLSLAARTTCLEVSPSARSNFCMISLDSTSFFLFGGVSGDGNTESYLRDSWIYKVGSGWTAVPQTNADPSARRGLTCTFLRGKVWMFGGKALAASNDIWSFDPTTNTWKQEYDSKTSQDDGQQQFGFVQR
ncbi:hypothetical protein DFS34DRAFT_648108 [Phlyctochytrium arcticum]|nr:hypothetical protein DFS34DRAFT_648108 [Phlyctochytrium arcticum]